MFKGNRKYFWLIGGMFLLMVVVQYSAPQPVDWRPTYMTNAKGAKGCHVVYQLLRRMNPAMETNTVTLYNLKSTADSGSTMLIIDENIYFDDNDCEAAFEMLDHGVNLVIASDNFGGHLFDSLHINTTYYFTSNINDIIKPVRDSCVLMTANNLKQKKFKYRSHDYTNHFSNFDSSKFHVRAYLLDSLPCVVQGQVGKGKLTLMTCQDVFANYMMVDTARRDLAYSLLSLNNTNHLIWDEYYKKFNRRGLSKTKESIFSFIFSSDALYAGYLLMIFTFITYLILESRRTQRAIPVKEPLVNSTLDFVNVISQVYFNSKNHSHIARERVVYFYENVRRKFGVQTSQIDDAMMDRVSQLSGCKLAAVRQLFAYTESLLKRDDVTEFDLVELNRQIYNFNKNSLR